MNAGKVALAIICIVGLFVILSSIAGMFCFDHC